MTILTATRYALNKDSEYAADWNDGTPTENSEDQVAYYRSLIIAVPAEYGQELSDKVNSGEDLTWDDYNNANVCVQSTSSSSGYLYPSIYLSNLYGKVIKQSGRPTLIKLIIALCFVLAVIVSGLFTGFSMSTLIQNGGKFFDITSEMFPFILSFDGGVSVNTDVFTYFIETTIEIMPDLIVTINMAFIGTLIGAVIAFFIGMATASNTNTERFSRTILKLIMTLIRTLPVLVMAIILTYIFGIGEFAGVIAIIIFSVGILAKIFYEFIETVSMAPSEAAMASGSTKIRNKLING